MNLDTFTPPTREEGDRVPSKEMVGRPLIVQVREHRTGVRTKFNSDPTDTKTYKAEGGDAVLLDIADVSTGAVYLNVLWFNGAIVDSLKSYVASALPVKLFYDTPKTGTNPYLNVEPLTGPELAAAHAWAAANPHRFEAERAARAARAAANGGMPPVPGAPTQPPSWAAGLVAPTAPPAAMPATYAPAYTTPAGYAPPVTPTAATQPATPPTPLPPAPVVTATAHAPVDVNDPAIQALLAQIAAQSK